eukprot:scaffold6562_cov342-Prasinococcus_capsulatus_cf.AAC.2
MDPHREVLGKLLGGTGFPLPSSQGRGRWVDSEVVILGANFNSSACAAADRVVPAVVAKLQLEGAGPQGLAEHLVTHADSKHGALAKQLLHILYRVGNGRGIPRPVAQEHPIRVQGHDLRCRCCGGHHRHLGPIRCETA